MKKFNIKTSYLSILVLFLASCSTFEKLPEGYNFGPAPSNIESKVRGYFEYILKDPSSANYRVGSPFKAYQNEGLITGGGIQWTGYAVYVDINAKNSFGGYTGYKKYLVYFTGQNITFHCKMRENLNESIMDVCNDVVFNRY